MIVKRQHGDLTAFDFGKAGFQTNLSRTEPPSRRMKEPVTITS